MTKIFPPCWLCFVDGAGRPGRGQETLEIAQGEAMRLAALTGKRVWVFASTESFEPPPPPEFAPSGRKIIRVKKVDSPENA